MTSVALSRTMPARDPGPGAGAGVRMGWTMAAYWFAIVMLMPLYIGDTGRPQPADLALVPLMALTFALRRSSPARETRAVVQSLAAYVICVVAVNLIWAMITARLDFGISTLFYIFNLLVLVTVCRLHARYRERFLRLSLWASGACILAQAALAVTMGDELRQGPRLVLFFMNANQLAYFMLCMVTVVAALSRCFAVPAWVLFGLALCTLYVEYHTYSRAGMLGTFLVVALVLSRRPAFVLLGGIPGLLYLLSSESILSTDSLWSSRIEWVSGAGTVDYLEDRGLQRIVDNPRYLLLGAGEGFHARFHSRALELHSSFATIAFSYGLAGILLFGVFLRRVSRAAGGMLSLYGIPLILYGMFHNGLRFRPFWLAMGLLVIAGSALRDRERAAEHARQDETAGRRAATPGWPGAKESAVPGERGAGSGDSTEPLPA